MFRPEDNRPMTSQFAFRVAVLGGFALVAFVVIFFRLWFLEVLSGEAYLKEANANRVREISIPAPRGDLLDRNRNVLVDNRTSLALQINPDKLFPDLKDRNAELRKLGKISDMGVEKIRREIKEQTALLPASPVTLQEKVDFELVSFLRERQDRFPGVTAGEVFVRDYPQGRTGAHLYGFVSEIGPEALEEPAYSELDPGDRIGATGIEAQYDSILRGRAGAIRVQVDAFGEPRGAPLSRVEPKAGDNLVLTLDKKIQEAGQAAISQFGLPAAFVAMDVDDGSILGMGSYPDFDPNVYTPPVSTNAIEALTDDESTPLLNRAIQAGYPTGSTFKLITATAALEEGAITPEEVYQDVGFIKVGDQDIQNAGRVANGPVNMIDSLRVSSDTYYYELGIELEEMGEGLQDWGRQYGFGSLTGIDLPGEGAGLLPTPEWREELYNDAADADSCGGKQRLYGIEDSETGEVCYETDRPWTVGDNINLSVGQGDLSATPLQLAVAYAALGNGGEVVRPHLADRAENALGQVTQDIDPAPGRQLEISEETRSTIMEGLRQAAMEPGGTSYGIFGGFPVEIAGKTGTAETTSGIDQSWYAALAPADNPEVVVIVTVERGGFGAETAAPAASQILSQYFNVGSREIDQVDAAGTVVE